MSDDAANIATPSQTVGPFFHFALCAQPMNRMIDRLPPGEPIALKLCVWDGDGRPVSDALIELCQAGVFGRMPTNEHGCCEFQTIRPVAAPSNAAVRQAPHIDVCLFARGLLRHLHTRIYFSDDPLIAGDSTFALLPEDGRTTLLARPDGETAGRWTFDLRLQGAHETVFFDA
jgi:protocatechuate 3,4-dioxygenase alpha subunit